MTGGVLGVDPGTRKTGYALLDAAGCVVVQGITDPEHLQACLRDLAQTRPVEAIALGKGTNARALRVELAQLGLPIHMVDERETSLNARALYFQEHPPRGWRRLIPLGMQMPPRPIDDYAAILIARRFLAGLGKGRTGVRRN